MHRVDLSDKLLQTTSLSDVTVRDQRKQYGGHKLIGSELIAYFDISDAKLIQDGDRSLMTSRT